MNENIEQVGEVPGTTILVDKDGQVQNYLGGVKLNHQSETDIILIPQPSDTDQNDPLLWSPKWKKLHITILFFYTLINACAAHWTTTVYTLFTKDFNTSYSNLNQVTGAQNLVLAFSCIFSQPFANKFGRRPTYICSTIICLVAFIAFAGARSYAGYMVYGVLIGLGVGPMDSLVGPSVHDVFFLHQHGYMAAYVIALGFGSNFGIVISGYIVETTKKWEWCLYVLIILDVCVLIFAIFFLEESLYHRDTKDKIAIVESHSQESNEKEEIKETVEVDNLSQIPRKPFWQRITFLSLDKANKSNIFELTIAPIKTFRYPAVIFTSLIYGIQICWLQLFGVTLSQFYSAPPYNFTSEAIGNMNWAGIVGTIIGAAYLQISDWYQVYRAKKNNGIAEPEHKLDLWYVPMILNVLGLFLYGYGPKYGYHWVVGAIGIGLINIGIFSLTTISLTYVMESYPKQTSKTMVAVLFVRNIMSAIFTWVFQYWLEGLGVIWLVAMLGLLCFFINASVLIMVFWGKSFRQKTAHWYFNSVQD